MVSWLSVYLRNAAQDRFASSGAEQNLFVPFEIPHWTLVAASARLALSEFVEFEKIELDVREKSLS